MAWNRRTSRARNRQSSEAQSRRISGARRAALAVALAVLWGLGPSVSPAKAHRAATRPDACLGAGARLADTSEQIRAARQIGLVRAEGATNFPLGAALLPDRALSKGRQGVSRAGSEGPRKRFGGSPFYRYQTNVEPLALSPFRLRVGSGQQTDRAGDGPDTKPFYRKSWFLAGAGGLVVVTAILLARGGGEKEGSPTGGGSLPGFPPLPQRFMFSLAPAGANGPSR
jgi:hypothetical protein